MKLKQRLPIKLPTLLCTSLIVGQSFLLSSSALAMPANPNSFIEKQPDGTEITLHIKGNEKFHWLEDNEGYTVIHKNGVYSYARLNREGDLSATSARVGLIKPSSLGILKGILPSLAKRLGSDPTSSSAAIQKVAPAGVVKNLVVMIRFFNHGSRTLPTTSDMEFLFNTPGGHPTHAPTGSLKDVYLENSYGQMTLDSDFSGWINLTQTEDLYADGNSGLGPRFKDAIRDALVIIDQTVDFSQYDSDSDGFIDSITFLHSGYGAEWGGTDSSGLETVDRIWSHKSSIPTWTSGEGVQVSDYHVSPALWGRSGNNIGRIGVIAHETGHFFGLPDLYDIDSEGAGIGSWGLMANSWGFDGSQLYPPHFSAWSKIQLGWVIPTTIDSDGDYSLAEVETNPEIFRIDQGFPAGEYLLIENRQPTGFDSLIPQGGLAIWHIDDNTATPYMEGFPGQAGWPSNGNHYRVALLQADGNYSLEEGANTGDLGDLFHATGVDTIDPGSFGSHPNTDAYQGGTILNTGHSINTISAAGSSMSFCLGNCAPIVVIAPSALTAAASSATSIILNWADNSSNENNFELERSLDGNTWTPLVSLSTNITQYVDSGLNQLTTYYYRVRASIGGNKSGFSNDANATTQDVAPIAASNMVATATSSSEISLTWDDNANNETGYRLERSTNQSNWSLVVNLLANSESHNDTGLASGTTYYYRVFAYNTIGDALSAAFSNATTDIIVLPPTTIDYVAIDENNTHGRVHGNYLATHNDDHLTQSLTETSNWWRGHDYLEHRWTFDITEGNVVTLFANTWVRRGRSFWWGGGSVDNFNFEYSTDGVNYFPAFVVSSNSSNNIQSSVLPTGISGTVYVRVMDTDRNPGDWDRQTIMVDHMYIRSEGTTVAASKAE